MSEHGDKVTPGLHPKQEAAGKSEKQQEAQTEHQPAEQNNDRHTES